MNMEGICRTTEEDMNKAGVSPQDVAATTKDRDDGCEILKKDNGQKIEEDVKSKKTGSGIILSQPFGSLSILKNLIGTSPLRSFGNLTTLIWLYTTFFNSKSNFDNIMNLYQMYKSYMNPRVEIVIHEYDNSWRHNKLYGFVERYLRDSASLKASKLRANTERGDKPFALTIDAGEHITDEFQGAEFTWGYHRVKSEKTRFYSSSDQCYYTLSFGRKHRHALLDKYLAHVVDTSRALSSRNRRKKLYTNSVKEDSTWTSVDFNHPANFNTLAMDWRKKEDIKDDLTSFRKGKGYYARMGKAWKRGYLLYGPPGTGKSTMIAAMANFMDYDIYDLELTSVKNNTALRTLLTNTTNKSILVIEDIDCSLDLSGKRKQKEKKVKGKKNYSTDSSVTLSGLLNFIDGLWSTYGEERLVVFTTNHIKKLDPALIRRGRMDMHIELSYCTFEAFKVLAENYLEIDSHLLFDEVGELLKIKEITPADVAEVLICNSSCPSPLEVTERLEELIRVLQKIQVKKKDKDKEDDGDSVLV